MRARPKKKKTGPLRNTGNDSETTLLVFREKSAVLLILLQVQNNSATMKYIFMTYYNYLRENYC